MGRITPPQNGTYGNFEFPGDCVPQPAFGGLSGSARTLTAGRIYLVRYAPPKGRVLTLGGFTTSTASSTDDPIEVALYSSHATTLTRLATSGAVSAKLNAAVGAKTVPLSVTVDRGTVYYAAVGAATIGGTTPALAGFLPVQADQMNIYGTAGGKFGFGFIDGVFSGGVMPATITVASINTGLGTGPSIVLRES